MPEIPAPIQQLYTLGSQMAQEGRQLPLPSNLLLKARQALGYEEVSLRRFGWDIAWTEKIASLMEEGREEIEAHQRALQEIEGALASDNWLDLEKGCRDLRLSAEALVGVWVQLTREAGRGQVLSPYPVYDQLLKVAQNIQAGRVEPKILRNFYAPAVEFTLRLRAAVKRFGLFYGPSPLLEAAQRVMDNIEAGMGALDLYLEKGEERPLREGSQLLVGATLTMYTVMADMGQWAAAERRYARHPLVEELFRAREVGLEGQDLETLWKAVEAALKLELTQVQVLLQHPLAVLCEVHTETLRAGMARVGSIVRQAQKRPLNEVNLPELDIMLTNLDRLIKNDLTRINVECRLVAGAPNFEELLVSVGLMASGKLEAGAFQVILQEVWQSIERVRESLGAAINCLEAKDLELLEHCLSVQLDSCQRLSQWEPGSDPAPLREAWRRLSETLPTTKRLNNELRRKLGVESAPQAPSGATCMRCGHLNPPQARFCSKCSSALIQMAPSAPTEYMDLEGGIDGPKSSSHILQLEALVQQVESGQAYKDEVARALEPLLESAYAYRGLYERRVRPALAERNLSQEVGVPFEEAMETYIGGLEICQAYLDEPNIEYLYQGLEQAALGASQLQALESDLQAYY